MSKACNAKSVMLPHSKAKVEFYQRYLELYLIILSAAEFTTEINIYDLFCGRGEYDDGGLGSAIRAYETIMKVRREHPTEKPKPIVLHLNDKNKAFVNNVQQYISSHYGSEPAPCRMDFSHRDAFELLNDINENKLKKQRGTGIVNFFFIDPYGYKKVSRDTLFDIMKSGNSVILLFLPVSFMHRFTQNSFSRKPNRGSLALRTMIESLFPEDHPIRSEKPMDIDTYIECLTIAFHKQCECFTTSYSIERGKGNKFALFFFSRNAKGFEVMLSVKWKLVDSYGFGYHLAEHEIDIFRDQFSEWKKEELIGKFRNAFIRWLARGPRSNSQIYIATITSGYLPKHANAVLKELQQNGQLRVTEYWTNVEKKEKNVFRVNYHERKSPSLLIQALCVPQK